MRPNKRLKLPAPVFNGSGCRLHPPASGRSIADLGAIDPARSAVQQAIPLRRAHAEFFHRHVVPIQLALELVMKSCDAFAQVSIWREADVARGPRRDSPLKRTISSSNLRSSALGTEGNVLEQERRGSRK